MADFSPNLRLTLIGDGEQNGVWGQTTNKNLGTLLEQAISGVIQVTVTATDVTLTASDGESDQARNMVLELTGTSTAACNIIVPAVDKVYVISNRTTGGFTHTVKTASGAGVAVPAGISCLVYCNGSDVVAANKDTATVSTSTPSGGVDGDVWYQVS